MQGPCSSSRWQRRRLAAIRRRVNSLLSIPRISREPTTSAMTLARTPRGTHRLSRRQPSRREPKPWSYSPTCTVVWCRSFGRSLSWRRTGRRWRNGSIHGMNSSTSDTDTRMLFEPRIRTCMSQSAMKATDQPWRCPGSQGHTGCPAAPRVPNHFQRLARRLPGRRRRCRRVESSGR